MAEISAQLVKQLRERTGAGMMECKKALQEANGDLAEAEVVLRKRGIAGAGKKESRSTKQGLIGSYISRTARLGVLVEVIASPISWPVPKIFRRLAADVAAHIAASKAQVCPCRRRDRSRARQLQRTRSALRAEVCKGSERHRRRVGEEQDREARREHQCLPLRCLRSRRATAWSAITSTPALRLACCLK